ncbi:MAG: hypothetical protein ACPLWC_00400 [Candidatus Woesearchaeota archaeon]
MKNLLAVVEDERAFFVDNKRIKSLKELVEELKTMNEELFRKHVNEEKNDFANWIKDVFGEEEIARKIYAINDRQEIINILNAEIEKAEKRENGESANVDFEFSKAEKTNETSKDVEEREKKPEELSMKGPAENTPEKIGQTQEEGKETSEASVRAITTENLPKTKKPIIYFIIGFALGLVLGIGGLIFYLYKFRGLKIF